MSLLSILSLFTKVNSTLPVVEQTAHALLTTSSSLAKAAGHDSVAEHIDTIAAKAAEDVQLAKAVIGLAGSFAAQIVSGVETVTHQVSDGAQQESQAQ